MGVHYIETLVYVESFNHTVQKYCRVRMIMGGGCGPQKINLSSRSGIIYGHSIALVRHKQAQMCLQNDPKCYERFSTKF